MGTDRMWVCLGCPLETGALILAENIFKFFYLLRKIRRVTSSLKLKLSFERKICPENSGRNFRVQGIEK